MFFGCKFLKASTERVLLQKTERLQLLWDFCTKKVSRNRWNRCHCSSEALTVLRCWGLLQIFKFQGVPQRFQVRVTRDSPEGHVVLEWNQKRAFLGFCLILRSKNFLSLHTQEQSLVPGLVACQDATGQEGRQGKVPICWHIFYAERKTDSPQFRSALLQGCWRMQADFVNVLATRLYSPLFFHGLIRNVSRIAAALEVQVNTTRERCCQCFTDKSMRNIIKGSY